MNSKKKLLLSVVFISLFLFISLVSAANTITLDAPAQDASISGTYSINSTLDSNTLNITSVEFFYKIGAGSWVSVGTTTNTSAAQVTFNKSFDTTSIIDDDDLTFNATASNETGAVTSDTSTGVDIDNTNPTATWGSSAIAGTISFRPSESWIIQTEVDSNGVDSCTIFIGSSSDTISASGNICSKTYTAISFGIDTGVHTAIIQVHDGNEDLTNSSSRQLIIDSEASGSSSRPSSSRSFLRNISNLFRNIFDKIIFWN